MAVTIPITLIGKDISARVGGDNLGRLFDGQSFKAQPIINDHDHLMLVGLYLGGLKVQTLMMEIGRAETNLSFGKHYSGTY